MTLRLAVPALFLCSALSFGQNASAVSPGQSIADALRSSTQADFSFMPQGMFQPSAGSLNSLVQYPTDSVSVVKLTGAQIRLALERSVSLFPTDSPAFLYVSGLSFAFNPSNPAEKRITSFSGAGGPVEPGTTYRVAMPGNLAKGGLGYFKLWSKQNIEAKTFGTLEELLKGKSASAPEPRWKVG